MELMLPAAAVMNGSVWRSPSGSVPWIAMGMASLTDGNLHTEPFMTDAAGNISYLTKTTFAKSGEHKVQLFVLGGSLAAETDGPMMSVFVP